ncbi:MAG: hypothetical protein RBG13Loki_0756 [Promethearchaeota archaeon CR_4]|nr:MAG: hypothetical protein RBG13Loki_0756 [Candidatus Lokiarchaeota archaeon CR_4]
MALRRSHISDSCLYLILFVFATFTVPYLILHSTGVVEEGIDLLISICVAIVAAILVGIVMIIRYVRKKNQYKQVSSVFEDIKEIDSETYKAFILSNVKGEIKTHLSENWGVPLEYTPGLKNVIPPEDKIFYSDICAIVYEGYSPYLGTIRKEWEGQVIFTNKGYAFPIIADLDSPSTSFDRKTAQIGILKYFPWNSIVAHVSIQNGEFKISYGRGRLGVQLKRNPYRERNLSSPESALWHNFHNGFVVNLILSEKRKLLDYLLENMGNIPIYERKLVTIYKTISH